MVRRIQEQLNEQESTSVSLYVDGIYGNATKNAVTQFQETNDLYVDGIVGPRTMRLLELGENSIWDADRTGQVLEEFGITANTLTTAESSNLLNILENNTAYNNRINYEVDTAVASHIVFSEEEMIILYVDFKDIPNIQVTAYFSPQEELVQFAIVDVFGDLYTDTVTFATFDVEGTSVESLEYSNVELENISLETQIQFQEAVEEVRESSAVRTSSIDSVEEFKELVIHLGCVTLTGVTGSLVAKGFATFLVNPPTGFIVVTGATIGGAIGSVICPSFK